MCNQHTNIEKTGHKFAMLAVEFLRDYAGRLGDDGCNDWDFPSDWDEIDKGAFRQAVAMWSGDEEMAQMPCIPNWVVAQTLAWLMDKGAEQ